MSADPTPTWRRALLAFGRFWWEFLVGDTPELLVGSVAAVGLVALLVHGVDVRVLVVGALPVLVVGLLTLSLLRGRSRAVTDARASAPSEDES
ncbi:MAG: hypothetical protein ACRDY1_01365 [Acidimicrobiales bacterium]